MLIIFYGQGPHERMRAFPLGPVASNQVLSRDRHCQRACEQNNRTTKGEDSVLCYVCELHIPRNVGTCVLNYVGVTWGRARGRKSLSYVFFLRKNSFFDY